MCRHKQLTGATCVQLGLRASRERPIEGQMVANSSLKNSHLTVPDMATFWSSRPLTATITKKYFKVGTAIMAMVWSVASVHSVNYLQSGSMNVNSLPDHFKKWPLSSREDIKVLGAVATLTHMRMDPSDEYFQGRPPMTLKRVGRLQKNAGVVPVGTYDGISNKACNNPKGTR